MLVSRCEDEVAADHCHVHPNDSHGAPCTRLTSSKTGQIQFLVNIRRFVTTELRKRVLGLVSMSYTNVLEYFYCGREVSAYSAGYTRTVELCFQQVGWSLNPN